MDEALLVSSDSRRTAGILLLAVLAVQAGGFFMLRLVRGRHPATPFQFAFSRAGHAHAGALVILSLIVQVYADAAGLSGVAETLGRSAIPLAAILMPAGFFFSSMGRDVTEPNRWIVLVYAGALSLAVGAVALGIGLLTS